ncbi:non-ribosomal peptide synthetase [Solwaraspora sp. WMMB762]|uniref:non-ribosomal peptide synthetase n=1 Tax=Solwaraspora sp. WMMB762 TaxID=3404120 RepID=UPI003B930C08
MAYAVPSQPLITKSRPGRTPDDPLPHGLAAALPGTPPLLPQSVDEHVRARPHATAVQGESDSLSYRALDDWAAALAARLTAAGVGNRDTVAVVMEPSVAMVAAVLAVWRAGAAYVPIDPAQPDLRVAAVLADAAVAAVVTSPATEPRLRAAGRPLVVAHRPEPAPQPGPAAEATADDPAYVIYTSGSTGEPKGVLVTHGQLAASTAARRLVYPGAPAFLLVSPLAFDSSIAGIWGTLSAGGRLVVAAADEVRDPERLVRLVCHRRVTHLLCVPSLYAVLLDAADRAGPDALQSLDTVITAGEALPETLLRRHFATHGLRVCLVNEYGPTEATVWATYRRFTGPAPVSIGGPIPGGRVYVLDDDLRPVGRGVEGELFVGGAGVAHGYLGQPEATEKAFLPDPFDATPGARMYRTGDMARWNDEGTLDFLGRRDDQIKIRGHRVELGAVDSALRAVPVVRDAAVLPDETRTAMEAFVVADQAVSAESVRLELFRQVPAAMVPARIHVVPEFPLTVNGKVDREALRRYAAHPTPAPTAQPTRDGATAQVAAAWAEVLKVADVPVDVNFFDLGGHSLTMFQLQGALERRTGTRPSVVALFRHTTVAAQAELIGRGGTDTGPVDDPRQAVVERARAARARRVRA